MYYKLVSHREVAAKLKVARLQKGWTGVEAGEQAGMPQSQVSRIENGHQRVFTPGLRAKVQTLADVLGVTDLRWDEASDAERVEELVEDTTAEVVADEQRDRKLRIASYFKRPTRTYADEILLMLDLHGAGMLNEHEVLSNVENLALLAKGQEVAAVGELDSRTGSLNKYIRQFS